MQREVGRIIAFLTSLFHSTALPHVPPSVLH
jgi:hypothetical protein